MAEQSSSEVSERWAVVEKMNLTTQYAFAGDYTGECRALQTCTYRSNSIDGNS